MSKKSFLVIGNPVEHSLSPVLHNYWFKKYNINAEYSAKKLENHEIEPIISKIKSGEISGLNITLPYKKKIIPYLDKMVNDSLETKSVNTIFLDKDKKIVGENTDVYGIQAGYLKNIPDKDLNNFKVLILGAGGVAPSIIFALQKSQVKSIFISNRTFEKALFLKKQFPSLEILKWEDYKNNLGIFDIIINATSLGLKNGQEFKEPLKGYKKTLTYIDTIYNPKETKNIKELKSNNILTLNGLEMFLYQGQKSFYLWNKINPEIDSELINIINKKIND